VNRPEPLELDLDLGYPDPAPPPDLADRARIRGRAIRRRRTGIKMGALASSVVVAALALLSSGHLPWASQRAVRPADGTRISASGLAALPLNTGHGPSIVQPKSWSQKSMQPKGKIIVLRTYSDRSQSLAWVSRGGGMCYGSQLDPTAPDPPAGRKSGSGPEPSLCSPLTNVPAQGLYQLAQWGDGNSPPDSEQAQTTVLSGLVRGPVTRVAIDLPSGLVDAHLIPAPDARLGTFYWVTTNEFAMDGTVAGTGARQIPGRTVFRGDQPVFHCEQIECLAQT
jgi:hypothetical protein